MPTNPTPAPRRLLMIEFFARGGLLHYSWQLAQGLAAAAPSAAQPPWEVLLLTGRHPEVTGEPRGVRLLPLLGTWNPHHRPRGIPRRVVRAWRGLRYVVAWLQILAATRRLQPEVVLLGDLEHRCDAWFVKRLRRQLQRQPTPGKLADIWHNVEAFERNRPGQLVRAAAWRPRMAAQFDAVFVHGDHLATQFARLTGRQATAIAHGNQDWIAAQAGADPGLAARYALPEGQTVALLFGTLSPYKGVDDLIEALAAMPAAQRPLALIAGLPTAAVSPQAWQEQARRLGVEAWLRWELGYVPTAEIAWYFRRADLVVLPYRAASQSGVAHLALSFGKPLIVTATGSLPELIAGNGFVVSPGDAPALAQALTELCGDEDLRLRWGRRSRELAETRHGWVAIAASLWAQLAAQPALAAPAPSPGLTAGLRLAAADARPAQGITKLP